MKILEIIPQLSTGGAERLVVDLCNELSKTESVYLLVFYDIKNEGYYASEISDKVNLITLNKALGFSPTLYRKIYTLLLSIKPDVVHMHLDAINYLWPFALSFSNIKFYMTIHNDAIKEAGGHLGRFVRKLMFKSQKIFPITISKQSYKSFVDYYNINFAPIIYNGRKIFQSVSPSQTIIDEFKRYRITEKTKIIINVASVTVVKQQLVLTKVARRLWEEGKDFQILIVGRHVDSEVIRQINEINCPCVHLLGEKTNPLDYMYLSDAFCLVSTYEGLPISLIEAMSVGLVPLCTPVGGIVDLVSDGDNGLLAYNHSEDAIYELLSRYLSMEEQIPQMENKAIHIAKEYSIENCAAYHLSLFKA
jgi:glycosyltransferase involved in cell wall biosynthesis